VTRKLNIAKLTWSENYVTHIVWIFKKDDFITITPFITIFMNYPVVIFWSSSLLLLFQVARFCTILKLSIYWLLVVLFRWLLKPFTVASTFLVDASIFTVTATWISKWVSLRNANLSPFSLMRDFGEQNTRGNLSKISVSLTCYRHIGSKFTDHSPLAWRREG